MGNILKYSVKVERVDNNNSIATRGDFELVLGTKQGDSTVGFNAAETLLSAFGACLITNINSLSKKMRLKIEDVMIKIKGIRTDDPPMLKEINYEISISTNEERKHIEKLIALSLKYGTVTNTLLNGTHISGKLRLKKEE